MSLRATLILHYAIMFYVYDIYLTVALTWSQLLCQLANWGVDVVRNYNAHCIIEMYFMTFFRSGCQSTEFIESRWQIQKYGEMVVNSTYTHTHTHTHTYLYQAAKCKWRALRHTCLLLLPVLGGMPASHQGMQAKTIVAKNMFIRKKI